MKDKKEGAGHSPYSKQTKGYRELTELLKELQAIRNMAWKYSIKYRFDPILGQIHAKYLNLLNELAKEKKNE